jgi:hypothetical protein
MLNDNYLVTIYYLLTKLMINEYKLFKIYR